MHRTIGDSYGLDSGKRIFREESPGNWDATQLQARDANSYQEEIARVIEDSGIVLNGPTETISQMNQLSTVIQNYIAAEAFTRNARDRIYSGVLLQDEVNNVNDEYGETVLLEVFRALTSKPTGWLTNKSGSVSAIVGPGYALDASNTIIIRNTSSMAKQVNATWVLGTGNGGRPATVALIDNTWYHYFLIKRASDGLVDGGFDNVLNASNLLTASGFNYYRRVCSVFYINAVNGLRDFHHVPDTDYFLHPTHILDWNAAVPLTPTITSIPLTKGAPPDFSTTVDVYVQATYTGAYWEVNLWDGPNGSTSPAGLCAKLFGADGTTQFDNFRMRTRDAIAPNLYAESRVGGAVSLSLVTQGYIDRRYMPAPS